MSQRFFGSAAVMVAIFAVSQATAVGDEPVRVSHGLQVLYTFDETAGETVHDRSGMLTIGGDDASTVTRGLFVLHDLLRGVVSDPPPDVDTTPVPAEPGLSQRQIAEGRIADTSCGACHSKFEPPSSTAVSSCWTSFSAGALPSDIT